MLYVIAASRAVQCQQCCLIHVACICLLAGLTPSSCLLRQARHNGAVVLIYRVVQCAHTPSAAAAALHVSAPPHVHMCVNNALDGAWVWMSCAGKGWESFTSAALTALAKQRSGLVFLLWGKYAQDRCAKLDMRKHHVLKSVHPSPLSAHRVGQCYR